MSEDLKNLPSDGQYTEVEREIMKMTTVVNEIHVVLQNIRGASGLDKVIS